jgi:hypothetical protein
MCGNYSVACGGKHRQFRCRNRRNEGVFSPEGASGPSMNRLGAKGLNAATDGSDFFTPFVKALENKKSSEITLRLNSYEV